MKPNLTRFLLRASILLVSFAALANPKEPVTKVWVEAEPRPMFDVMGVPASNYSAAIRVQTTQDGKIIEEGLFYYSISENTYRHIQSGGTVIIDGDSLIPAPRGTPLTKTLPISESNANDRDFKDFKPPPGGKSSYQLSSGSGLALGPIDFSLSPYFQPRDYGLMRQLQEARRAQIDRFYDNAMKGWAANQINAIQNHNAQFYNKEEEVKAITEIFKNLKNTENVFAVSSVRPTPYPEPVAHTQPMLDKLMDPLWSSVTPVTTPTSLEDAFETVDQISKLQKTISMYENAGASKHSEYLAKELRRNFVNEHGLMVRLPMTDEILKPFGLVNARLLTDPHTSEGRRIRQNINTLRKAQSIVASRCSAVLDTSASSGLSSGELTSVTSACSQFRDVAVNLEAGEFLLDRLTYHEQSAAADELRSRLQKSIDFTRGFVKGAAVGAVDFVKALVTAIPELIINAPDIYRAAASAIENWPAAWSKITAFSEEKWQEIINANPEQLGEILGHVSVDVASLFVGGSIAKISEVTKITKAAVGVSAMRVAAFKAVAEAHAVGTITAEHAHKLANLAKVAPELAKGLARDVLSTGDAAFAARAISTLPEKMPRLSRMTIKTVDEVTSDLEFFPYAKKGLVVSGQTLEDLTAFRVHAEVRRKRGRWMSPINPLNTTVDDFVNTFALKKSADTEYFVTKFNIPKGTKIEMSIAGPIEFSPSSLRSGGGLQYRILEDVPTNWIDSTMDGVPFK